MAQLVGDQSRGNVVITTKQASGAAKIDPLMAAFNAMAWMVSAPKQPSMFWTWAKTDQWGC